MVVVHARNPGTRAATAKRQGPEASLDAFRVHTERVPGQAGMHSETLTKSNKIKP